MRALSRRHLLATGGALAAFGARPAKASEDLSAWLALHAVPIRSIDAADEDFSDLAPLAQAIGAARVVLLGEPSHGAGSAFAAKARIVRFLHQHRGFDVLIWEAGFYDVALADAGMRGADDALTAARRGVSSVWSQAREVEPLFAYIKASQAGLRPLGMAGFGMQMAADGAYARFAEDLRAFVAAPADPALRAHSVDLAEQALAARDRLVAGKFSTQADLDALTRATDGLTALIRQNPNDIAAIASAVDAAFMARAIDNMRLDAALRVEAAHTPATTADRESRRDAIGADNLLWLLGAKFAGRKAIVWAHNAHLMNAYATVGYHDIHLDPQSGDMTPMGVRVAPRLRGDVYTLGITAYAGEDGFATDGSTQTLAPAPAGSVEACLHALGHAYAFVDMSGPSAAPGNPLRRPQSLRMPKYECTTVADPGQVYNGLVFIDDMLRATPV